MRALSVSGAHTSTDGSRDLPYLPALDISLSRLPRKCQTEGVACKQCYPSEEPVLQPHSTIWWTVMRRGRVVQHQGR